jgi:hypothetical protein
VNKANELDWQTGARGNTGPQRLSGALANHSPPPPGRIRLSLASSQFAKGSSW